MSHPTVRACVPLFVILFVPLVTFKLIVSPLTPLDALYVVACAVLSYVHVSVPQDTATLFAVIFAVVV